MRNDLQQMRHVVYARSDWVIWAFLLFGLIFAYAGWAVDPSSNCDDSGNCASWPVHIGRWIGTILVLCSLWQFIRNPSQGSYIDSETGDLVWWNYHAKGIKSRIHPTKIGLIQIIRRDESADVMSLYNLEGNRLPYFHEQLIRGSVDDWAHNFSQKWPHIKVEIK